MLIESWQQIEQSKSSIWNANSIEINTSDSTILQFISSIPRLTIHQRVIKSRLFPSLYIPLFRQFFFFVSLFSCYYYYSSSLCVCLLLLFCYPALVTHTTTRAAVIAHQSVVRVTFSHLKKKKTLKKKAEHQNVNYIPYKKTTNPKSSKFNRKTKKKLN